MGPWVLQLARESNCQKGNELISYIVIIGENTGEIPTQIDVVIYMECILLVMI